MTTWTPSPKIDAIDASLGLACWEGYMPPMAEIPEKFKRDRNPHCLLASKWFFGGIKSRELGTVREGIDGRQAMRHLAALLRSFAPSHEHKEAGVAYLMSLWFEIPITSGMAS